MADLAEERALIARRFAGPSGCALGISGDGASSP
jgi:hypothetical protein